MMDDFAKAEVAEDLKRKPRIGLRLTLKKGMDRDTFIYGLAHGLQFAGLRGTIKRGYVDEKRPFFITIDHHAAPPKKGGKKSSIAANSSGGGQLVPSKFSQRFDLTKLPLKDEACRCGEKDCWLVKWDEE